MVTSGQVAFHETISAAMRRGVYKTSEVHFEDKKYWTLSFQC